ncbi:hypothetical protein ACIQ1J_09815 [Streptomyces sp. NPDC097107]|uniref:hypothetical protein n=1 Tax=Streptomyces sp. NPDC097107 TaxID=3366089 RepID=UPI00380640A7
MSRPRGSPSRSADRESRLPGAAEARGRSRLAGRAPQGDVVRPDGYLGARFPLADAGSALSGRLGAAFRVVGAAP